MSIYDNEIDLSPYFRAIKKRWWQILLITFITSSAAFLFSILRVREYEAVATILLTRSRASLSLANQFPTITEPVDSRSRMDAMLSITESEGMVIETLDEIHQLYPDNGIDIEGLKDSVRIINNGDTIQIAATIDNPEYAALIANTWAKNAVTAINYAYTEEQLPSEILISLVPAKVDYERAQSELESFLMENQVAILQKQIDETSTLLDELVQDRTWKIAYNVRRKQKMEQVINQAEILQELLDSRETSLAAGLGDALAVIRLRAEAFGEIQIARETSSTNKIEDVPKGSTQDTTIILGPTQSDIIFDVQLAELIESIESGQDYQRDLEQIIQHAEEEMGNAESELLLLSQQSLNAEEDELFIVTSSRLRDLQSQLESEQSDLENKIGSRDLALEVYQALIRKEAEVRNNLQTSSTVTLASPAVPPIEPIGRGVLINTFLGAVVGLFLSTIWVVGAEWIKQIDKSEEIDQEDQ